MASRLDRQHDLPARQAIVARLLSLIRGRLHTAGSPAQMLIWLDLSLDLERESFRMGAEFQERLDASTHRERIAWLRNGIDVLYGIGVVIVEQFWSLTNSIYSTQKGKAWYGLVGTGGLIGGVIDGGAAAATIKYTPLQTPDLLLVVAIIILALTALMGRVGIYCEVDGTGSPTETRGGWKALARSRYLLLIAALLLLAQLASPLVEYQFLNTVEMSHPELEARTAFLSIFFGLLGLISIAVNLGLTPLVHKYLGVIAGLMIGLCSWGFLLHPSLLLGSATKISGGGLSYSINRASKELLYVPIDTVLIYQAKAWIDMFGYRMFKIFGSLLILMFTRWLPITVSVPQLSWLVILICGLWIRLIMILRRDYRLVA